MKFYPYGNGSGKSFSHAEGGGGKKCFGVVFTILKGWRKRFLLFERGLPFSTYAPRGGGGGFKSPIHFLCVLHAKRGGGGPDSM